MSNSRTQGMSCTTPDDQRPRQVRLRRALLRCTGLFHMTLSRLEVTSLRSLFAEPRTTMPRIRKKSRIIPRQLSSVCPQSRAPQS